MKVKYNKMDNIINTKYGTKSYPLKTKKEAFIDFENYNNESIQYSFNAEIAKLKKQLNEANEKIAELNGELEELRIEVKTIQALKEE